MTKKHASVLFAFLCTLLCASPLFACTPAEEPWVIRETFPEQLRRSGEYQYAFSPERGEAAITNYLGTAEEVVVPAELDGHPVTEVRSLNNIYIKGTFKRVVLPDGLVEIGAEAFAQTRLEAVTIPDSVQRIGVDAFFGTPWLEAQTDEFVIVGDGVLIDYNTADDNPLNETNNLDIPDGVRFIAFRLSQTPIQMYRRHTVTIPGSVRAIGEDAFSNVRIEKLTISDGLQEIGDRAFYCSLETDHITLPNSVTHIGDEAFALNNTLKAAFLGNRTECIGAEAFAYCRSLQKITLPPTVACVGPGAFDGTAYRDGLTDEFVILGDGVLIDYNGNDKDVVVPEGVKFITDAFRDQPVEHVTLPDSLLRIGENAFAASALQSVRFGADSALTEVGDSAFADCKALREIVLPDSVTRIGDEAFSNCTTLVEFRFPAGLKSIGNGTFSDCKTLKSVCLPDSVYSIGSAAFSGCEQLEAAKLPEGITTLYDVFDGCERLETIDIPNGVREMQVAFNGCSALREVNLPASLEVVGISAFRDCSALERIVLPEGIREIQQDAFYNCTSLSEVILPEDFRSIGIYAFGNTALVRRLHEENGAFAVFHNVLIGYDGDTAEVVVPDGIERIAASFYQYNDPTVTPITSLVFPDSVTEINEHALQNCSELRELTFGDGVRTIAAELLIHCSKLEKVTFGRGLTCIERQTSLRWAKNALLYVPAGSYALDWAREHGFTYRVID